MHRSCSHATVRHAMALVACLSLFGLPAVLSASDYRTQHVVVLVMDGARYTETWGDSTHTYIPKIAANLAPKGTVLSAFRTNIVTAVGGNTETCPGHATLSTGTYQKIANDGSQLPTQPTIFQYFRKQSGAADTAAWVVTAKDKLWICSNSSASGWNGLYRPRFNCGVNGDGTGGYRSDSETHSVVLSTLTTYRPSLMLINYKDPDSMGHAANWTGYLNAIKATDGFADEVWLTIQADPQLRDTTTLFVTNDHGRHTSDYTSHGDNCEGCTHLLAVAVGPDFKQGVVSNTARQQTDIAATAAHLLNINMSSSLQGALMSELLKTPVVSSASTATATIGASFTYQIVASSRPTAYSATGLPAGLSLNTTTGSITGIPSGPVGVSSVQLSATNAGGIGAPMTLTLTVTGATTDGGGTVDVRVAASSDDAEETVSTGAVNLTSTDLELLVDSSPQVVGIRFPNVDVPRGATVTTAYVQFKTDEAVNANPTSLTVAGEATDNAATFTTASKNISSRARTAAAVVWSPPDWTVVGEAGANQRTPELKAIVQEIVNRSGWAKGNSLAVIVTGVSTSKRVAEAYDKGTGGAPVLHIVYSVSSTNQAPQILSQPWANPNPVTLPNTTTLSVMATDDGLPNPPAKLTYTWSKVSGPGSVTFAGNNGTDTADDCVASFTTPGNYVVKVTVSDGALTATGQVTVTVTANYAAGLKAEFFDYTTALSTLPDLTGKTADVTRVDAQVYYPSTSGTWANLDSRFTDYFASRHSGYLKVDTAADYTLYLNSDDGSKLYVDGALLIDNNGLHGMTEKTVVKNLSIGYHAVRIEYFENTGGAGLSFSWSSAAISKQIVPASALYRDAPTGANKAPTVSLTSPANGATLTAPASFSLNAIANDADGTISKVEFYRGTTLLSTDTSSPYSYTWSGVLAGVYSLTVKAYDNSGAVTTSGAIAVTVTPNYTTGLKAEFFDYTIALSTIPDLTGKTADITRVDAQIDYPSTSGTWANLDSRFSDTYASRHTGYLKVATAGDYTLYLNSDDGSRLYLDGVLVINNDGLHGMTEKSVLKNLAAGYHAVKVEFFENGGGAGLSFSWSGPSIGKQIIPASVLYYDAAVGSN